MAHRTTHYLRIGSRRVLHAAVSLNRLPAASVAATMSDEQETESAYAWYTADARQEVLELLKAFLLHTIQEGKLGDLSLLGQEQGALVSLDLHFRTLPQRTWFLCPQKEAQLAFSSARLEPFGLVVRASPGQALLQSIGDARVPDRAEEDCRRGMQPSPVLLVSPLPPTGQSNKSLLPSSTAAFSGFDEDDGLTPQSLNPTTPAKLPQSASASEISPSLLDSPAPKPPVISTFNPEALQQALPRARPQLGVISNERLVAFTKQSLKVMMDIFQGSVHSSRHQEYRKKGKARSALKFTVRACTRSAQSRSKPQVVMMIMLFVVRFASEASQTCSKRLFWTS
eukprot:m.833449 g.833449  ORF g.833449 m.833449 type:complete len:340 (+) comp59465_c0_seq67:2394-3413(+)